MAPTQPNQDESSGPQQAGASSTSPSATVPDSTNGGSGGAGDIAQAYKDLTRGEQAATALEANLAKLESRLDELLAGFETDAAAEEAPRTDSSGGRGPAGSDAPGPAEK